MERKTNTRMRSGLVASLVGASALVNTARAQEGWFNLQPAYKLDVGSPTLRLEGGANLGEGFSLYGFLDVDSPQEEKWDIGSAYGELRLNYSLDSLFKDVEPLKGFKLATEYNGGTESEDLLRFGLQYDTSLGKGNFLSLRAFPFETSGDAGPKLGLFTTQELTDHVSAQLLLNYYPEQNAFYMEPELDVKLWDNVKLFIQGRSYGEMDGDFFKEMTPVIGIKFEF